MLRARHQLNENRLTAELTNADAQRPKSEGTPATRGGMLRTPSVSAAIVNVPTGERRSVVVRYGTAILFVATALMVTLAVKPFIANVIFVFFWPAVVSAAMLGGVGPGVVASFLS